MNKLSHSSASRYLRCGYSHKLHYIDKLRPKTSSAALLFGSALDSAINVLLAVKLENPPKQEQTALQEFYKNWESGWINGKKISIPTSLQLVYADSDLDLEILTEADYFKINELTQVTLGMPYTAEVLESLIEQKKSVGYKNLTEQAITIFNYINWLCLSRKAEFIIKAYEAEVMPRIKKVISIQKKIELDNGKGDSVVGYIDLIAEMDDGNVYILDNKSSGRGYDEDAVENSPQLALYGLMEGNSKAGFIVYLKALQKNRSKICSACGYDGSGARHKTCNNIVSGQRCNGEWMEKINPQAKIQILLGDINPNLENMVLDNLNTVNDMINKEIYVRNLDSCENWFGSTCAYKSHCYNNDNSDLEKVD